MWMERGRDLGVCGLMALGLLGSLALAGCPSQENNDITKKKNNTQGPSCINLCVASERSCLNDETVLSCVQDAQGCYDFGDPTPCPGERRCRQGMCVIPGEEGCLDECEPGSFVCSVDGRSQECGDFNEDGCFEYGEGLPCDAGSACDQSSGQCAAVSCQDACQAQTSRCEGELVSSCRRGPEGCLVFGPAKDCPGGTSCQGGDCVAQTMCEDECIRDERLCSPDGSPRVCRDGDGDGCVEFVTEAPCAASSPCRAGQCVSANACQDQCARGQSACDGAQIKTCRDTNGDGCVEFDSPQACPTPGQLCVQSASGAACQAPAVSGRVVINEVFYDALGADVDSQGRSPTFIELKGPAGLSVANFEVRLVNGANGMSYQSVKLPAGATLDGGGFAVLTLDKPDAFLSIAVSNVYPILMPYASNQDALQNGPDNVELYDASGARADALGYGSFNASEVFTGEGMPAPAAYRGRSLGRRPGAPDTNNNAVDFVSYFPTPGQENADLVINEIYFDQPGADGVVDQMETFIELVAPIQGWQDLELEGYVLRAINGANDQDYIFTGQLNGIVLSTQAPHELMGSDGDVVICNLGVTPALLNRCQIAYDGVDFQNGPDSFVLEYRGRVIDAVGYGTFGPNDTFRGEGMAAPFSRSNAGKSLSRWPLRDPSRVRDTDNNRVDFHLTDPTPGADNQLPTP